MIRKIYIGCLLVFLLTAFLNADFQMTDWEYSKPIEFGDNTKEGYVRLGIDKDIFEHARHDLSDLRIIDNQQREVPYKLIVNNQTVKETAVQAKIFNKSFVPDENTVFMMDMGEEQIHRNNKLVINTPDHNFKCRVEINGSDDQTKWLVLRNDCYIFDISTRDFQSSHTTLEYPENNYKYLRVTILDNREKPLEVTDATLFYRTIQKAEENLIPYQIISRTLNSKEV